MARTGRLACLALGLLTLTGAPAGEPSREAAQRQLDKLNDTIRTTQAELVKSRTHLAAKPKQRWSCPSSQAAKLVKSRTHLADEQQALKALDLEIQANALDLRDLRKRRDAHQAELAGLQARRVDFLAKLAQDRAQLGAQVRAAWRLGRESRIKVILNQDSPARFDRTLAYYDYFSHAQAARLNSLKSELAGLDEIAAGMEKQLAALDRVEAGLVDAENRLAARRSERLALLAKLSASVDSDEARLQELLRDRADLEKLLESLRDALADIPPDLGAGMHPDQQRGHLPMPVRGRVLSAFGQSRGAGLHWQGWLIEAPAGTEVHAIAYGRVAYADWLRGYGLLLIIDHGEGFMSLYGRNESLLFDVGDWVQPGEVIATSGGGEGEYFELRNRGKAVDPAGWISRR